MTFIACTPKSLTPDLLIESAVTACAINPLNAPFFRGFVPHAAPLLPEHIAVMTSKYWGTGGVKLGVTFLDSPPADLKARILLHMNAWGKDANVVFAPSSKGEVRILRQSGQGYWSYLGTDILHIPTSQQTMNLEAFTMDTPDSEFYRVVRHEVGHTLGFPHEHLRKELVSRIDPNKAIPYFMSTQGWSRQEVIQQVLTPLDDRSLMETPADQTSIMCYQLDGSITYDGNPIIGGMDINATDEAFAAKIYPKEITVPPPPPPPIVPPVVDPPVPPMPPSPLDSLSKIVLWDKNNKPYRYDVTRTS